MVGGLSLTFAGVQIADGDPLNLGVVETFDPQGERAIDTAVRIRAAAPKFLDRITYSQSLRFTIFISHATQRAALAFALSNGRATLGVGDLVAQIIEDGVVWQATLASAALRRDKPQVIGVATETSYELDIATVAITEDGVPLSDTVSDGSHNYFALAPAAAGTDTPAISSSFRETVIDVAMAAGSGAYTRYLVLNPTSLRDGDTCEIGINIPATANPTIDVRDTSSGGAQLFTVAGDATVERNFYLKLWVKAGAWGLKLRQEII